MPLYQVNAGDRILAADINQMYALLKGVAASGESVTLIYNAAGVLVLQPSSDPATGTELIQVKNNAGTVQLALSSDGKVYAADGTALLPGVTWEQDKDTGAYRISANASALVAGGSEKLRWDATGISIDGGSFYLPTTLTEQIARWAWDWDGKAVIESTLVGTGVYAIAPSVNTYAQFGTGATTGGSSAGRVQVGAGGAGQNGVGKLRAAKFHFQYGQIDANMSSKIYLTDESVTGSPSDTARHIGLRQAGAVINFSTGDNATEQATDITSGFTAGTDVFVDITFNGTTALCYVNGTLKATHATNVPAIVSAAVPIFRVYVVTAANAAKNIYFSKVHTVYTV